MKQESEKRDQAIAIVGIGCRFPGSGETPEEFWQALLNKVDGIVPVPKDRWNRDAFYHPDYRTRGKMHVKEGGFIQDIDQFDPSVFGISPMEAQVMDPQQRLLLEHTFMAFEDAGLTLEKLAGSKTGVFVGLSATDYAAIQNSVTERAVIGAQTNTGISASIAANRLSFVFDLRGPSFIVDTACSSSLFAAHLACRSLRSGESDAAVVGGVNLILRPELHIGFSTGGFLSPDARSKTFDASANGYIRSEGVGVVVLKPLKNAVRDGDRIYATIIGSALGEDGKTDGIAKPNPDAQIAVMEEAYRDAGISPSLVSYVEAHGTGTAVGDPIECGSIGSVVGKGRSEPCLVGSVKSNIGHLESGSGIAGLIKLALSLHHGKVPPSIHFHTPNPAIDFEGLHLSVPTSPTELSRSNGEIYAGLNSFGFGGANAHMVLQSFTPRPGSKTNEKLAEPIPLVLSAATKDALHKLAGQYADRLESNDSAEDFRELTRGAAVKRSAMDLRLAVNTDESREAATLLRKYRSGDSDPRLCVGRSVFRRRDKLAFVYTGQGPQWFAMGRELLTSNRIFADTAMEVGEILKKLGWLEQEKSDLLTEMNKNEEESRINETHIVQPALFALQVGLTRIWHSRGISPAGVVGHSIGEVAASYAAGALTLEEATRVVYWRSRCQTKASGRGKMLAVGLAREAALDRIRAYSGKIDLAAVNGPEMMTLAGDTESLHHLAETLEKEDVFHRLLVVDVPFHCYLLDDVKDDFIHQAPHIGSQPTELDLYSTVTGTLIPGERLDTTYWAHNIRDTVLFFPTLAQMVADGYREFVEIGPHPILSHGIQAALDSSKKKGLVVPSLRRKKPEAETLSMSLAQLFVHGVPVNWEKACEGNIGHVDLPRYPWQKDRYWNETDLSRQLRSGERPHPHLTREIRSSDLQSEVTWDVDLDHRVQPYIEDHRVQGPLVFPGAGHVDLAAAVGCQSFGENFGFLEDLRFFDPLFLPDEGAPYAVRFQVRSDQGRYTIASNRGKDNWTVHSSGKINHLGDRFVSESIDLNAAFARMQTPVAVDNLYDALNRGGLQLGDTFRGIKKLIHGAGETWAEIEAHPSVHHDIGSFNLHPSLLDSAFQTAFGMVDDPSELGVYIPVSIDRVRFTGTRATPKLIVYARARNYPAEYLGADIWIFDSNRQLLAEIQGFKAKYLKGSKGEVSGEIDNWLYEYSWQTKMHWAKELDRRPAEYLADQGDVITGVKQTIEAISREPVYQSYLHDFSPAVETLAEGYMVNALLELGFEFDPERRFAAEEEAARLGIQQRHLALWQRILQHLTIRQVLEEHNGQFCSKKAPSVSPSPSSSEMSDIISDLRDRYSSFAVELEWIETAGPKLAPVLRGEIDPVQLLFSESNLGRLDSYYADAEAFRKYNQMVARAVEELVAKVPQQQPLRILEIGAGTGGVTACILPLLPHDRTEYVFTDLSAAFLERARDRFREYSFVSYRQLDIEQDVEAQGERLASYDLVIASNVIHATKNVRDSLNEVGRVLAGGGVLLLLEVTEILMYLDLTFGLTEGWWRFEDREVRPSHCVLPPDGWLAELQVSGYEDAAPLSDVPDGSGLVQQTLFVAHKSLSPDDKVAAPELEPGVWLIFADDKGVASGLAERFSARGDVCHLVYPGERFNLQSNGVSTVPWTDAGAMTAVLDRAEKAGPLRGVVHLWSLYQTTTLAANSKSLAEHLQQVAFSGPTLTTVLSKRQLDNPAFAFVTAGAQSVLDADPIALFSAAIWGYARSVMNESPSLGLRIMDLSSDTPALEVDQLFQDLIHPVPDMREEEVAFRKHTRYVHRLDRLHRSRAKQRAMLTLPASGSNYELAVGNSGIIEDVQFETQEAEAIQSDEVEIAVRFAPLNFRDVMVAGSLLPDEAVLGGLFHRRLGLECAGIVKTVGPDVSTLHPGDQVIAFASGCIGGTVRAKEQLTRRIPQTLPLKQAATIPMAYITAHYALCSLARLAPGERVLIHSAAGGVGLAAVRLAKLIGAEVFATASPHKHDFLREQGTDHLLPSRSPTYYDTIMELTAGKGVDVVLNSLPDIHITQSLRSLAPCGRFVEIGKTDFYRDKELVLSLLADNKSYLVVDIDRLLIQKPELMRRELDTVIELFASGKLEPHPQTIYPICKAKDALQELAKGEHIGKIQLSMEGEIQAAPAPHIKLSRDASYLVAGGTRGFGLTTAKFLAERGAGHIALMSRNGITSTEARDEVARIRSHGTKVSTIQGDITSMEDVQAAVAACHRPEHPLKGVFQSTLALSDTPFANLTLEEFLVPTAPKVVGTWNLHLATKDIPLDHFVCYSSVASTYGTPGQSNYAAANSFLDMFAHYRQSLGLPGTTINWGVIGQVGFVARTEKVRDFLTNFGWSPLDPPQALQVLERVLTEKPVSIAALRCDWRSLQQAFPHNIRSLRFSHLHQENRVGSEIADTAAPLRTRLEELDEQEGLMLLLSHLGEMLSKIVGISSSKVDLDLPITRMGLDSLMANQVRSWLTTQTGLDFSLMQIMQGPTIQELSAEILGRLAANKDDDNEETEPWDLFAPALKNIDAPRIRLLCFPYLGAGGSVFSDFEHLAENGVEVRVIQLPGRENRDNEEAEVDGDRLISSLAEAILPLFDLPCVFYGHSFGGNLAASLAAYLENIHRTGPVHVVLGASVAPEVESPLEYLFSRADAGDTNRVPDAVLIELLEKLGAPESLLKNETMVAEMLPGIRADLQISAKRLIPQGLVLRCPITAVRGTVDRLYTQEMIAPWSAHTEEFASLQIEGSHLFVHESSARAEIFRLLSDIFLRYLGTSDVAPSATSEKEKKPNLTKQTNQATTRFSH